MPIYKPFTHLLCVLSLFQLSTSTTQAVQQPGRPADLDRVANYRAWHRITNKPVWVPNRLATLCRSLTQAESDRYRGPHDNNFIHVYVNKASANAMGSKRAKAHPIGTTIVKEKLPSSDATAPTLLTVMIKREKGYDPKRGDWEYAVTDGTGKKVIERGRLKNCVGCHARQAARDYLFKSYLPAKSKKVAAAAAAGSYNVLTSRHSGEARRQ